MDQKIPTVVAATVIALLPPAELGFPSKFLIEPFVPWLKWLSLVVLQRSRVDIHVSGFLLSTFRKNDLNFVRSSDTYWYIWEYVGVTSQGDLGWMLEEAKEIYDSCQQHLQDELIVRNSEGKHTGNVRAVLFPESVALLEHFDPKLWAARMENITAFSRLSLRPTNMLWTQIVLLDVAIHYLLRRGWYEGHKEGFNLWIKENLATIKAVIHSWDRSCDGSFPSESEKADGNPSSPPVVASQADPISTSPDSKQQSDNTKVGNDGEDAGTPSGLAASKEKTSDAQPANEPKTASETLDWDLAGCLAKQPDLKFSDDADEQKRKIQQLANLLQMRSLFYIAFLMLIPDSTDVFLAEKSDVEMPMI
jgi:hypothetical protein